MKKGYYWLLTISITKRNKSELVFNSLSDISSVLNFSLRHIQKLIKTDKWDHLSFRIDKIKATQISGETMIQSFKVPVLVYAPDILNSNKTETEVKINQ